MVGGPVTMQRTHSLAEDQLLFYVFNVNCA